VRHGLNVISSRTNDHTGNGSHGRGAARQINQQIGSNTTWLNQGWLLMDATSIRQIAVAPRI